MRKLLFFIGFLTTFTAFCQEKKTVTKPIPSSEAIAKDNASEKLKIASEEFIKANDTYNLDNSDKNNSILTEKKSILDKATKTYNDALAVETKNASTEIITPFNILLTSKEIKGNASPNSIVQFVINNSNIISITVNNYGYFVYSFQKDITDNDSIKLWGIDSNKKITIENQYKIETSDSLLDKILNKTRIIPENNLKNPEIDGSQSPSTTFRYKVKMLNTNFTVPLARFNFMSDDSASKKGEISLFNSVGAGFGISWGEIEKTTDANGSTLNIDYTNTISLNFGFLFSSGKDGETQKNVFAPTISCGILDFQLGVGYELGTTIINQKGTFLTLAYAIPLSKLMKGKYYIFRASKGYNSNNPLPATNSNSNTRNSKHKFI